MRETVKLLCADHSKSKDGLKVLNVGFGLGIVSGSFDLPTLSPIRLAVKDRFILPRVSDLTGVTRHH